MKNLRPINIQPYDPAWPAFYESEKVRISEACQQWIQGIEHIGSTSVPGLGAKATVDIIIGVGDEQATAHCITALQSLGYTFWPGFFISLPGRFDMVFKEVNAERVCNLHIAEMDGLFWRRHLLFRNYLRQHPDVAREYQALKEELAQKHSPDVDAYATAKTDFIRAVEQQAGWLNY